MDSERKNFIENGSFNELNKAMKYIIRNSLMLCFEQVIKCKGKTMVTEKAMEQ